ncbi:MAG TPA: thioredoxin domain-containing protein [Gemmatimonas sp.]|nr:thioredoxin domain-containing protein [Gemmatimonas sp.]
MVKATPKKSRAPFYGLVLVALAVGGAAIWYSVNGKPPEAITLAEGTKLPTAAGQLRGKADAPVAIIEFADFECPGCGQYALLQEPDIFKRLVETGLASYRFYDFPLVDIHSNTMIAHLAAACAADQGKFWEMHDQIFAGQFDWNTQATSEPRRVIDTYATKVGLDVGAYDVCMSSRKHLAQIEANRQEGIKLGVGSTPTIVVNNKLYPGGLTFDGLKALVDSTIKAMPAGATIPADSAKK